MSRGLKPATGLKPRGPKPEKAEEDSSEFQQSDNGFKPPDSNQPNQKIADYDTTAATPPTTIPKSTTASITTRDHRLHA